MLLSGSTLSSSTAIAWNSVTNAEADLELAHNATITISGLEPRQSISLSGTMVGSGGHTVIIEHAGLTLVPMGGSLDDIEYLAVNDSFEIVCKRNKTELRYWVTTLKA
jgi:hypothetical protein